METFIDKEGKEGEFMTECYFADYTIGEDAYQNIEAVCAPLGRRALIVGGETALSKAEGKLRAAMSGFTIIDAVVYGKECFRRRIAELYDMYKESAVDFVVGVGGGKAIDTSKCLADSLGVPVVTVPTIASTCAATSALAVVYTEEHAYEGFWHLKRPAHHCFIDISIIAEAPDMYFRAGIGDTLAKYYEVEFSARGRKTTYNDEMALSISRMCAEPLFKNAHKALDDCKAGVVSEELCDVARIILVSCGMVSMLVNEKFNGALAHALFYGLTVLDGFEEKFLHGDVIGYTTTVQLTLDGRPDEAKKVAELIRSLGVETTLGERGIDTSRGALEEVLQSTLRDPDMEAVPYEITAQMIYDAIIATETEGRQ